MPTPTTHPFVPTDQTVVLHYGDTMTLADRLAASLANDRAGFRA